MQKTLHILNLEDNPNDSELLQATLEEEGMACEITRVETKQDYIAAIAQGGFDLILADYKLPSFDGLSALTIARERCPDVPFILISGTIGEELAVESMKNGAADYILKDKLFRLGPAVRRSLQEAQERSDRKKAEDFLRQSEEKYRNLVERSHDGIIIIQDGIIVFANARMAELDGSSLDQLVGTPFTDHVHPSELPRLVDIYRRRMAGEMVSSGYETVLLRQDGSSAPAEMNAALITYSEKPADMVIIRDIAERKKAEEALQESSQFNRKIIDSAQEGIIVYGRDLKYLVWNPFMEQLTGIPAGEVLGRHPLEVFPFLREAGVISAIEKALRGETAEAARFPFHVPKTGRSGWTSDKSAPLRNAKGEVIGVIATVRDITEHVQDEEFLRKSESEIQSILASTADGILAVDTRGKVIKTNKRFAEMWRIPQALLDTVDDGALLNVVLEQLSEPEEFLKKVRLLYGTTHEDMDTLIFKDGRVFERYSAPMMMAGSAIGRVWSFRDISARKKTEAEMLNLNRTLRTISGCNEALMRAEDEARLLDDICRLVVESGGYTSAWVGYAEQDEQKTVRAVAQRGFEPEYVSALNITWADAERGRGPTGKAIRTGEPCLARDILTDPAYLPWRDMALQHGYSSIISLPLLSDGKALGALTIYSSEPDPFHEEEVKLLSELAGDLSYGIMVLRARKETTALYQKINEEAEVSDSLLQIVEALNATLDEKTLIQTLTNITPHYLKFDRVSVFLVDEDLKGFTFLGGYGFTPVQEGFLLSKAFKKGDFPAVDKLLNKETICIENARETDLLPKDLRDTLELGGMVMIPISFRGTIMGGIMGMYKAENALKRKDMTLLKGLADGIAIALQNSRLYKESMERLMQLSGKIETIKAMAELDREILTSTDRKTILQIVTAVINRIIPCERVAVVLMKGDYYSVATEWGMGQFVGKQYLIKGSHCDAFRKNQMSVYSPDISGDDCPYHIEESLIGIKSVLLVPLVTREGVVGFLDIGTSQRGKLTPSDLSTAENIASQVAVALENARLFEDLEQLLISTITSLASAIDAKSPWTKGHSERVTEYAVEIGKEMGLAEHELERLRLSGLLHDVGKIGTYDILLDKPGKLTTEEFELVKKHPRKGAEILSPIKQLSDIIPGVCHHHERYDGKGYPDGLKGEEIPLQARILCVADSFDSMTADRPYRPSPGKEYAISEFKRCEGTQFDPKVVEVFLKVLERMHSSD